MSSALRSLAPPPPPNPQGALSAGVQQAPQASPQQMPAPSHQQTVAALRHFDAIGKQLEIALKDPELGKSDIRSKVIDGMTTLVADRIIPPGQAVTQLATFPDRPFEQRKWLIDHLQQTQQAKNMVLSHHALGNAGGAPEPTPSADTHMQDLQGMMSAHYQGKPNG